MMETINVADVLQEAGDADSRARTRCQGQVQYLIIPYTPHLWDCLICTRNFVSIVLLLWMIGEKMVDLYPGGGGGVGLGIIS